MPTIDVHIGLLKGIKRLDIAPEYYRDKEDSHRVTIHDIETKLSKKEIDILKSLAKQAYEKKKEWQGISVTYTKLMQLAKFVNSEADLVVSSLDQLEKALKQYVERSPQRWMYLMMPDKTLVPFFVNSISYYNGSRDESARVVMQMLYENCDGEQKSKAFYFYKTDFNNSFEEEEEIDTEEEEESRPKKKKKGTSGVPVATLCRFKNLYLGTAELFEKYREQINVHLKVKNTTGKILIAKPDSWACYASWMSWRDEETFSTYKRTGSEESKAILVTDENDEEKVKQSYAYSWYNEYKERYTTTSLWGKEFSSSLPIHPIIKCFDLNAHLHCLIHVDNIIEKSFDSTMKDKLVLPEKDKTFIDLLMESSKIKMADIVEGKSGGVTILCTGSPGTGKTLTAEVYSETVGKPLYNVQCSQLGVDPEKLEKNLKKVLRRSERWKAIMILDEADVYIRERGQDIQQNAIVGVFLRVLEYFSGVLFMTTNKLNSEIDDAIISRCTAHLRYKNFSGDLLEKGWKVLGAQYSVKLSDKDIKQLMEKWPELSGRNIKNLLKLSKSYSAATKKPIDFNVVSTVSEYSPALNKI